MDRICSEFQDQVLIWFLEEIKSAEADKISFKVKEILKCIVIIIIILIFKVDNNLMIQSENYRQRSITA